MSLTLRLEFKETSGEWKLVRSWYGNESREPASADQPFQPANREGPRLLALALIKFEMARESGEIEQDGSFDALIGDRAGQFLTIKSTAIKPAGWMNQMLPPVGSGKRAADFISSGRKDGEQTAKILGNNAACPTIIELIELTQAGSKALEGERLDLLIAYLEVRTAADVPKNKKKPIPGHLDVLKGAIEIRAQAFIEGLAGCLEFPNESAWTEANGVLTAFGGKQAVSLQLMSLISRETWQNDEIWGHYHNGVRQIAESSVRISRSRRVHVASKDVFEDLDLLIFYIALMLEENLSRIRSRIFALDPNEVRSTSSGGFQFDGIFLFDAGVFTDASDFPTAESRVIFSNISPYFIGSEDQTHERNFTLYRFPQEAISTAYYLLRGNFFRAWHYQNPNVRVTLPALLRRAAKHGEMLERIKAEVEPYPDLFPKLSNLLNDSNLSSRLESALNLKRGGSLPEVDEENLEDKLGPVRQELHDHEN